MSTVVLLICSNVFMTMAWYGHLRFKSTHLAVVILASWLIALPEYALQVPANRWGHGRFSAAQLKIMQEVVSISVFLAFSRWYLGERPQWHELAALTLVLAAVALMLLPQLRGLAH